MNFYIVKHHKFRLEGDFSLVEMYINNDIQAINTVRLTISILCKPVDPFIKCLQSYYSKKFYFLSFFWVHL